MSPDLLRTGAASFKRLLGSALDKLPFDDTARDAPPRRCCHEALLLDGNFVPMRAFHFYQPEFFSVLAPDNQVGTALGDLGVLVDRLELRSDEERKGLSTRAKALF